MRKRLKFRDLKRGMLISWHEYPEYLGLITSDKLVYNAKKKKDRYEYFNILVKRPIVGGCVERTIGKNDAVVAEIIKQHMGKRNFIFEVTENVEKIKAEILAEAI